MTATAIPVQSTLQEKVARMTRDLDRTMQALRDALQPALRKVGNSLMVFTRALEDVRLVANDPVHVAGMEARYYVRAAMDPTYATPEGLRQLVRCILNPDTEVAEGLWLMTRANRLLVAVSAMRGWETRGEERLWPVECDRSGASAYADAVGMPEYGSRCNGELWRCEGMTRLEPPLVAHRLWGTTAVEVSCG